MKLRARLRREDGAAAVEFALIVGVLAMLLFGMLQFGLAFFELQNLRAASREGARIGAVGADVPTIKQKVADSSTGAIPATSAAIEVRYTSNGTWPSGQVTGKPRYEIIPNLISGFDFHSSSRRASGTNRDWRVFITVSQ